MNDTKKIIGGIFLGAIAGAALVLFLQSNKGKLFVEKTKRNSQRFRRKTERQFNNCSNQLCYTYCKRQKFFRRIRTKISTK
jgi:gas vesicle protein